MIKINIPGKDEILELEYLVLDFNGTLALDGKIKPGAGELLAESAGRNLRQGFKCWAVYAMINKI
jgi:hypothetical protein